MSFRDDYQKQEKELVEGYLERINHDSDKPSLSEVADSLHRYAMIIHDKKSSAFTEFAAFKTMALSEDHPPEAMKRNLMLLMFVMTKGTARTRVPSFKGSASEYKKFYSDLVTDQEEHIPIIIDLMKRHDLLDLFDTFLNSKRSPCILSGEARAKFNEPLQRALEQRTEPMEGMPAEILPDGTKVVYSPDPAASIFTGPDLAMLSYKFIYNHGGIDKALIEFRAMQDRENSPVTEELSPAPTGPETTSVDDNPNTEKPSFAEAHQELFYQISLGNSVLPGNKTLEQKVAELNAVVGKNTGQPGNKMSQGLPITKQLIQADLKSGFDHEIKKLYIAGVLYTLTQKSINGAYQELKAIGTVPGSKRAFIKKAVQAITSDMRGSKAIFIDIIKKYDLLDLLDLAINDEKSKCILPDEPRNKLNDALQQAISQRAEPLNGHPAEVLPNGEQIIYAPGPIAIVITGNKCELLDYPSIYKQGGIQNALQWAIENPADAMENACMQILIEKYGDEEAKKLIMDGNWDADRVNALRQETAQEYLGENQDVFLIPKKQETTQDDPEKLSGEFTDKASDADGATEQPNPAPVEPENNSTPHDEPDNLIQTVILPNVLPDGYAEEVGPQELDFNKTANENEAEIRLQERDEWIIKALENHSFVDKEKTKAYVDPLGLNDLTGELYTVVDVHFLNGKRVQIAANRRVGRGVYIWHEDLIDYPDDAGRRTVEDLLDDLMVQRIICMAGDNNDPVKINHFVNQVIGAAQNPKAAKPMVKRHIVWQNKAMQATASVDAYIQDKLKTPPAEKTVIEHGEAGRDKSKILQSLKHRSYWLHLDTALKQGKIRGLEQYKTLEAFAQKRYELLMAGTKPPTQEDTPAAAM